MIAMLGMGALALAVAGCGTYCGSGCYTGCTAVEMVPGGGADSGDMPAFYKEFEHDGRFYVAGTEEMAGKFEENHHFPYTKTLIGAGPDGKTVVLQVDKKNPDLAARLEKEFFSRHPFYQEGEAHERIFVIGQRDTYEKFLENGHIPYTKTFIGEGPGGKTVVVEVDKKNPALTERLIKQFNEKHGTSLGQ